MTRCPSSPPQGIYAAGNAVGSLIGGGIYTALGPSGLFSITAVLLALTGAGLAIGVGLGPWGGGVGVAAGPYRRLTALGLAANGAVHDDVSHESGEGEGCGDQLGEEPVLPLKCSDEETALIRRVT